MKQSKNLLLLIPAVFVGLAAVAGFSQSSPVFEEIAFPQAVEAAAPDTVSETEESKTEETTEVESSSVVEEAATGSYTDGVYEGTGTGYAGDVKVKVTVENGQITTVEIVSSKDDAAFFNRAKVLTETIVKKQTWDVDGVSGATYSSRGIREAVKNALTGSKEQSAVVAKSSGKKKKASTSTYKGSGSWKDGVYTGSAEGYGGTIKVKVTIKMGKIDEISVTSHDGETASYYNKAKKIIAKMIKKQSPNVDTISGATYSSSGIKNAVIKALRKAEGKSSSKDDTKTETKPGTQIGDDGTKTPEGTIKDGTYHVSAECTPDADQDFTAYTLSCDVTFKDQKLVSMSNFSSTDESNKTYYDRAVNGRGSQTGVVAQLISAQSAAKINAVSGATCSSITIRKLYLAALTQATGVEQPGQDDTINQPDQDKNDQDKDNSGTDQPDNGNTTPDQPDNGDKDPDKPDNGDQEPDDGGEIKDGTYSVSATVEPDKNNDFKAYTLSCDVTFKNGYVTDMSNFTLSDVGQNQIYVDRAVKKVVPQILIKQSADVDNRSQATCSSKAIKELYKAALKKAKE